MASRVALLKNGLRVPCSVSSKEFLLSQPRGAYTSCRTVGMHSVFGFEEHVSRLARSVTLMMNTNSAQTSTFDYGISNAQSRTHNDQKSARCHYGQITDPALMRPWLVEHLSRAVRNFIEQYPIVREQSKPSGTSSCAHSDALQSQSLSYKDQRSGGVSQSHSDVSGRSSSSPKAEREFRFTILLTWVASPSTAVRSCDDQSSSADGKLKQPYDILIHTAELPAPPSPPIKVHIRRAEREYALAKDSQWVSDRASLEKDKPKDVDEILLEDGSGRVIEGMTSNFFVYRGGSIYTASTDDGILGGTVRRLILDVCKQLDIPVNLQPPQTSTIDDWAGAFISSTSRLMLPVDELSLVRRSDSSGDFSYKVYSFREDDVISKLQKAVHQQINENSSKVIELIPGS